MFFKSFARGFKCSSCGRRSLFLTPFGRHVFCRKCSPRYDKVLCSLLGLDLAVRNLHNSSKEVR